MPETPAARAVEFESEGTTVRGWLHEPEPVRAPRPAVAMVHGFTATSTGMVADQYAAAFAAVGITALIIDPRGFGRSDGEPRREVNAWKQGRDYLATIDCLSRHPHIDPERLAIWGDSMSGRVALVVAAVSKRVAAVVVQVPGCGDQPSPADPSGDCFAAIRDTLLTADLSNYKKMIDGPRPVVSLDQLNTPSLLTPATAYHWFLHYGALYGTEWENQATLVQLDTPAPFDPQPCAPHITAPLHMTVAEHDEMPGADADVARHTFDLAPEPKELLEIGGGHFGLLYHDSDEFETAVAAQQDFLVRHLIDA